MIREYQTQNELNPKLWKSGRLDPKLRLKLLKIAQHFYRYLGIDSPIKGVILTGSNVNYNWTDTSDIDLHVLINYKDINDSIPFVREYMMAKKSIWNNTYPLQYKGMPIELYAQDENEPHTSTGIYCLLTDKWIKEPSPEVISVDDVEIDRKADPYKFEIDNLKLDDPQLDDKISSLKMRLKRMRQTGLEASGEYSVENLAFKSLRNSGHLTKLTDLQHDRVMSSLAIDENKMKLKHLALEAVTKCPAPTQDINLNLKNRQKGIRETGYGPADPAQENKKFWDNKQEMWNTDTADELKNMICGTCAAFDITKKTLNCISKGIGGQETTDPYDVINAGQLGYCRFLKFKCASKRTCDAWVSGGPIKTETNEK